MLKEASEMAIKNSKIPFANIEYFISGDLLNQIISSAFTARELGSPFWAFMVRSTIAEGMGLGAILIDGGYADNLLVATSSHFYS